MSSLISTPPQNEFIDQRTVMDSTAGAGEPLPFRFARARPTTAWTTFFSNAYQLLFMLTLSGTTANRPVKFLWVGRYYFDTSLAAHGQPRWVASVNAAGVATWIDAASNVV